MGAGGQRHALAAFAPGKDPVPIVQEAGWAPGPVLTDAENVACTGIRSPGLPARSESLYRLSLLGPRIRRGLWLEKLMETSRLERWAVSERTILKWIVAKCDGKVCAGFIWLNKWKVGGFCTLGNECYDSTDCGECFDWLRNREPFGRNMLHGVKTFLG